MLCKVRVLLSGGTCTHAGEAATAPLVVRHATSGFFNNLSISLHMQSQKRKSTILLVGISALVSGCQTAIVKSDDKSKEGLVYALPKAQIQLDASRTLVTAKAVADAEKAATAAATAVTEATKAKDESAKALADAQAKLSVAGSTVKEGLTKERDLADAIARLRVAQLDAAKLAAKEAAERLKELRSKEGEFEQVVSLKALDPAPDRKARYVAVLEESYTRDDTVKITTANGLLATTSSESTGQLGAILVNIASALSGFSALKSNSVGVAQAPDPCKPFKYTTVFDPTSWAESSAAAAELAEVSQGTLSLRTEAEKAEEGKPASLTTETSEGSTPGPSVNPTRHLEGLFYRAQTSTTVTVKETRSTSCTLAASPSYARLTATVPDSSSLYLLPLRAGSFAKSKLDFEFKNGVPTSYRSEQQSQLNAIARIPVDILKAIVEVPASILKLRVDYQSQNAALFEAQTKQLKAELDVLKAQKALEDEKTKPPTTVTP